jgi:membrane-bound lytic murein transglycosylase D
MGRKLATAILLLMAALPVWAEGDGAAAKPTPPPRSTEAQRSPGTGDASDAVEQLLADSEAALRSGEEHLAAGHLESAREDFNRAVDLLLTSGYDLRQEPRLRFAFDRLVDRIHELERAALRDTAAAGEPPEVPASLDELVEAAPLTFPLDPQVRAQVEAELAALSPDIPIALNERVLSLVDWMQRPKGRRIVETGLRRAGRYREMINAILDEEGVPRDLIHLAQAESAFQPHARSRARAVGLWQFVSWRAQEYGLKINWWVDERRDPVKSTRAAARHLRDLYEQFGDWYLVLAAYNSGPMRVTRALDRAGSDADYWTLVERRLLPRETRSYVPIILAMTLVGKDPARFGVSVEPEPPLRFESVKVSKPTDLRRIAEVIGVDASVLRELNPHLLRNVTPPDDPDFELYVPVGTAETLVAELPRIPEAERVYWQQHRVRRGETLSGIGNRYSTSAQAIAQANGMSLKSTIHPGQVLVIPSGTSAGEVSRLMRSSRGSRTDDSGPVSVSGTYRVRSGDTLSGIAARHRVSTSALAQANGLSLRSIIRVGQRLEIPGRGESGSRSSQRASGNSNGGQVHRVRSGDTLWGLSQRYRVSVNELRRANPQLSSRELRAGDDLLIPE